MIQSTHILVLSQPEFVGSQVQAALARPPRATLFARLLRAARM
jgi:hypothetical protein